MAGNDREVNILLKLKQQLNQEFGNSARAIQDSIKAVDNAAKDLNETQKKSSDSSQKMGTSFVDVAAKLYLVEVAVKRVAEVLQFIYDTGKHGAEIEQIGVSFERVVTAAGGTTQVLEQLRQVTKGTVADSDLMIAVNQSLVGTTGAYKSAMVEALPALTEMARASAMLNPQFGDTTQQLDRLTLGLKRMEPRILDDIGLELRLTEVNKNYAEQIGKSTSELTSEEKQLALLNAVLQRQGEYVKLAGDNADSAVDPYTRMEAAAKNLYDTMAKGANTEVAPTAEAIGNWLEGVNNYLSATDRVLAANTAHQEEIKKTSKTYEEYIAEHNRSNQVTSDGATALVILTGKFEQLDDIQKNTVETNKALSREQFNVLHNIDQVTDAWDRNSYSVLKNSTAVRELSEEDQKWIDKKNKTLDNMFLQQIKINQKLIDNQEDYNAKIQNLNEDYNDNLGKTARRGAEDRVRIAEREAEDKAQIEQDYADRKAGLEKDLNELQMELEGKNPYVDEQTTQAIADQEALLKATKSNLETLKRDAKNGHAGPSMDAEIQATEDLIRQTEDNISKYKEEAREQERRGRLEARIKEKQDQIREAAEQKDRDLKNATEKAQKERDIQLAAEVQKTIDLKDEYDKRKGNIEESFAKVKEAAEKDLRGAAYDSILSLTDAGTKVHDKFEALKLFNEGATTDMVNAWGKLKSAIIDTTSFMDADIQGGMLNISTYISSAISATSNYSGMYGGRRATGGGVQGGKSYLVGEDGPEIVTMGGNGHVTPNNALGGGTVVVNINAGAYLGNRSDAVAFANMVGPLIADWQSRYGGATNAQGTRRIRS